MQVAELVPQVALVQRRCICRLEVCSPGKCFEHSEMGGTRFVQTCEQPVKRPDAPLWCDHQARPSFACVHASVGVGHSFECAHSSGANGDYTAVRGMC